MKKEKWDGKSRGNGYVRLLLEEGREEHILDCNKCDNQGEINDRTN